MATFRLILQSGSGAGTEYPLEKAELFLGRDLSNDIVINDPEVSRRHARLLMSGLTYSIEDLGSTNGTFIRGMRLGAPMMLKPGEIITIGEKVLLKFDAIDPNATVVAFRAPAQQTVVPPAPVYTPPQPVVPAAPPVQSVPPVYQPVQPVAPVYAPVAPASPVVTPAQPQSPAKKKKGWLVALLVVIAILLVFCIIPWVIIDATNSYCALFPGIFNALQPGVCP